MWRLKRQLIAIGILGLLVAIIVFGLFFFFRVPSDNEVQPLSPLQPPRLLWSRFFPVRTDVYDAAALVENPNNDRKAADIRYVFRLFDEHNVLITTKESRSFLNPAEQFVIFEPLAVTALRTPQRILFEIRDVTWQVADKKVLPVVVKQKQFEKDAVASRVRTVLSNTDIASTRSLEVIAVPLDEAGNAIAVAHAVIDALGAGEEREVVLTWPRVLPEPRIMQVYVRETQL
jgi:hypothetical protein